MWVLTLALILILVALGINLFVAGALLYSRPRPGQVATTARELNGGASDDYTPHRNKLLW